MQYEPEFSGFIRAFKAIKLSAGPQLASEAKTRETQAHGAVNPFNIN